MLWPRNWSQRLRHPRSLVPTVLVSVVVLVLMASSVVVARQPDIVSASGFRVLTGRAAASFTLPADVRAGPHMAG